MVFVSVKKLKTRRSDRVTDANEMSARTEQEDKTRIDARR